MFDNAIRIWKEKGKIFEGIRNNVFKQEHIEDIASYREMLCKECASYDTEGNSCLVYGTAPCCSECGCSLPFKLRALSADCPKGIWFAEVNDREADFIEQQINESKE